MIFMALKLLALGFAVFLMVGAILSKHFLTAIFIGAVICVSVAVTVFLSAYGKKKE